MDPVSIVGLVITIGQVGFTIQQYASDVKSARKDVKLLQNELDILQSLLEHLSNFLSHQVSASTQFNESSVLCRAVAGCDSQLKTLCAKLGKYQGKHRFSRIFRSLKWPLDQDDTLKEVEALHRYLQLFQVMITVEGYSIMSKRPNEALSEVMEKISRSGEETASQLSCVVELLDSWKDVPIEIKKIDKGIDRLEKKTNIIETTVKDQEFLNFLQWLPCLPFEERHQAIQDRRTEGCGSWLLESSTFTTWQRMSRGKTLWCPGVPGAGKTFLTSTVIDHVRSQQMYQPAACAYFYFDYMDRERQTALKVVGSLLQQVLSAFDKIPSAAAELFSRYKRSRPMPPVGDLEDALCEVCNQCNDACIILDALDECDAKLTRPTILKFIRKMMNQRIKILVTSRPFADDINDIFASCPSITIRADEADVREFLVKKLDDAPHMRRLIDSQVREEILATVVRNSQGMFLLPSLQIDAILGQTTPRGVRAALAALPTGLWGNLEMTVNRIRQQTSEERVSLAMATLMWVSYAKRPLKVEELRHGVAMEPEFKTIDDSYLSPPELLVECCMGLVVLDTETSVIRFSHLTVGEYLEQRSSNLYPHASSLITRVCIGYLTLDDYRSSQCQTNQDLLERVKKFPLLVYASEHWGNHARDSFGNENDIRGIVTQYVSNQANLDIWSQLELARESGWLHDNSWRIQYTKWLDGSDCLKYSKDFTLLHMAARFGLVNLVDHSDVVFLRYLNAETTQGDTALMLAAKYGHVEFLRVLLGQEGIQLNATNEKGLTALGCAIQKGCARAMEDLLCNPKVDINLGSPLRVAVEVGDKDAFYRLLADTRIDINGNDYATRPPLCETFTSLKPEMFHILLAREDLNPYSPNPNRLMDQGISLLYEDLDIVTHEEMNQLVKMLLALTDHAMKTMARDPEIPALNWLFSLAGFYDSSQLLIPMLNGGLDPLIKNRNGTTLLHTAARGRKNTELVAKLLESGCPAWSTDSEGLSPLHVIAAGSYRQDETLPQVELLLKNGAVVQAKDNDGWSVLHFAVLNGGAEMVQMFLDKGVSPFATDNEGQSVLHIAARGESKEVVSLLLHRGANPHAVTCKGVSVLHEACKSGTWETFDLLRSLGVRDAQPDKSGKTVLMDALLGGNADIVRSLLDYNADLSWRSARGETALAVAAWSENDNLLDLILDRGVGIDVRATEFGGTTALHYAIWRGNLHKCRRLLERGADPNARDAQWGTPIYLAALYHHNQCFQPLLDAGANPTIAGPTGKTALDIAAAYEPHFRQMGRWAASYVATPEYQIERTLLSSIQTILSMFLTEGVQQKGFYLTPLARLLLLKGNQDEAASILLEETFGSNGFTVKCSVCQERIARRSRFVCRSCTDVNLCPGCMEKYQNSTGKGRDSSDKDHMANDSIPWCREHEFLSVPRDIWSSLPSGRVNIENQTFKDWLIRFNEGMHRY